MKEHKLPSSKFQESEADRLIASYGKKPEPAKQQELEKSLRDQKEHFRSQSRQREGPSRPERGA